MNSQMQPPPYGAPPPAYGMPAPPDVQPPSAYGAPPTSGALPAYIENAGAMPAPPAYPPQGQPNAYGVYDPTNPAPMQ